jgi:hypothetical protein
MSLNIYVLPVVALIAGILILVRPQLMSLIIGVYLIVVGILGIVAGK